MAGESADSQVVLVVAAHPDDEILGGGATFAKRARRGDQVHAVVLCEGESIRYAPTQMVVGQQQDARQAAGVIGFSSFRCLMLPDQRLDSLSQIDLNGQLEKIIDELAPQVVYTHYPGDINVDHRVTHDSVMVATRPGRRRVCEVLGFETPSSTGMWTRDPFCPDTFEVVTDWLQIKLDAMQCYQSEAEAYPHPRSAQSLEARARYWGGIIHEAAAEPFVTLRRICR